MPREMVNALTEHIESQYRLFVPLEVNCTTPEAKAKLAKYLGKSASSILAFLVTPRGLTASSPFV